MIYEWRCKDCGFETEVDRTIEQRHRGPDKELDHNELCVSNGNAQWVRVYKSSTPFRVLRDRGVFMDEHGNYPPRKID